MITPEQISKARELLGWSIDDLARWSKVGHAAIFHFEIGTADLRDEGIARIKEVLEANGVVFPDGEAPRLKVPEAGLSVRNQATITPTECMEARRLLGWTQRDLAAKLNVSQSVISVFETGQDSPWILDRSRLRQVFEAAAVELRDGGPPRLKGA